MLSTKNFRPLAFVAAVAFMLMAVTSVEAMPKGPEYHSSGTLSKSGSHQQFGDHTRKLPASESIDAVHHEIQAQYLLDDPWSCEGLEVLYLQIVDVTRLSEEEVMDYKQELFFQWMNKTLSEAEVRTKEKYELQVQEQHRQIYGQLSKLVILRVLELGMEYWNL
ncbi:hypothetical protein BGZ95_001650 [Linnemannia exigua]|uniref:Uncharacterized protein n=1 Tax=Linnemannia exigua TaxID=604196 RepID=A0AAD4D754_9FUNG|nr:hypothetical protein BGZ95_001650 [Linnemannia exigua]